MTDRVTAGPISNIKSSEADDLLDGWPVYDTGYLALRKGGEVFAIITVSTPHEEILDALLQRIQTKSGGVEQ